jgi:lysophospholipase
MPFTLSRALTMPPGGTFKFIKTSDGIDLRTAHWPAPGGPAPGSVVLLQGRREFIEKYYEAIADLQDRGFEVYTFDWRGQGLSTRPLANRQKGYVESFDLFLSDLDQLMQKLVLPHGPRPLYLVGHSMGGHLGLRFLHDHPGIFEKAALSAPMIDIELGIFGGLSRRLVKTMIPLGRSLNYALFQGDFSEKSRAKEVDLLSSDPERLQVEVAHYRENPALELGGVTYGWLDAAFRSIDVLRSPGYPEAIKTPILMMTAGADKVVSRAAQAKLAHRLPHCQHKTIAKARHEILMERDPLRNQFWKAFGGFIGV